jgi:hypothetical protein
MYTIICYIYIEIERESYALPFGFDLCSICALAGGELLLHTGFVVAHGLIAMNSVYLLPSSHQPSGYDQVHVIENKNTTLSFCC